MLPQLSPPLLWLLVPVLAFFVFWLLSNIFSSRLGAPAISSPHDDLWQQVASPDQVWLDLGGGNGGLALRVEGKVKYVYAIEYSPFYYLVAFFRTFFNQHISIIYGDMFRTPLPAADIIYCYLLPGLLERLKPLLVGRKAILAAYCFAVPGWTPSGVITTTANLPGRHLYLYDLTTMPPVV